MKFHAAMHASYQMTGTADDDAEEACETAATTTSTSAAGLLLLTGGQGCEDIGELVVLIDSQIEAGNSLVFCTS